MNTLYFVSEIFKVSLFAWNRCFGYWDGHFKQFIYIIIRRYLKDGVIIGHNFSGSIQSRNVLKAFLDQWKL